MHLSTTGRNVWPATCPSIGIMILVNVKNVLSTCTMISCRRSVLVAGRRKGSMRRVMSVWRWYAKDWLLSGMASSVLNVSCLCSGMRIPWLVTRARKDRTMIFGKRNVWLVPMGMMKSCLYVWKLKLLPRKQRSSRQKYLNAHLPLHSGMGMSVLRAIYPSTGTTQLEHAITAHLELTMTLWWKSVGHVRKVKHLISAHLRANDLTKLNSTLFLHIHFHIPLNFFTFV